MLVHHILIDGKTRLFGLKINLIEYIQIYSSEKYKRVSLLFLSPSPILARPQTLAQLYPALTPGLGPLAAQLPAPRPRRAHSPVARPAPTRTARAPSPFSLSLRSRARLSALSLPLSLSQRRGARLSASPLSSSLSREHGDIQRHHFFPPSLQAPIDGGHQSAFKPP